MGRQAAVLMYCLLSTAARDLPGCKQLGEKSNVEFEPKKYSGLVMKCLDC